MVYVILAEGFEEIEALAPVDILRRGGVEVKLVTIKDKTVIGSHGIVVESEMNIDEVKISEAECVFIPGGMRGVNNLLASDKVSALLSEAYASGAYVAAICAGPKVLSKAGLLSGKRATCYPGLESEVGADMTQESPVVIDGRIITSRAAGTAYHLGLALLEALKGSEAAEKVRAGIWFKA